uniref:Uncharacterized protein n=1 Tax=Romanomermis culicivorax TaxID=13658 RepID=A0A915HID6_ROMCU
MQMRIAIKLKVNVVKNRNLILSDRGFLGQMRTTRCAASMDGGGDVVLDAQGRGQKEVGNNHVDTWVDEHLTGLLEEIFTCCWPLTDERTFFHGLLDVKSHLDVCCKSSAGARQDRENCMNKSRLPGQNENLETYTIGLELLQGRIMVGIGSGFHSGYVALIFQFGHSFLRLLFKNLLLVYQAISNFKIT